MNEDSIDLGESTAKLTSAVENLPQILEKKRKIDSHTNIATSLLDEIKNRNLDEFYRIKDKIVKQGKLEKNIKDYLKDAEFGNDNDKLRLLLTYLLGTSVVYIVRLKLPMKMRRWSLMDNFTGSGQD